MRRNTLFWGSILIAGGILLLLSNMGLLPVDIWSLLWPLFLIALGAWILWGTIFRKQVAMEHANVPLEGANRARVLVRHGAGRLAIGAGTAMGDLAEGDFGGGVHIDARRNGELLDVTLSLPAKDFPFMNWGPGDSLNWNFTLARDIPISLDLETGANESRLELTDLIVTDLSLKSGASSTEINMPAGAGVTRARVETGAASVRVRVPDGVAGRITARGGLSDIHVDSQRFPRMGDVYQSPDFDTSPNRMELSIETGVGSVDVR